MQNVYEIQSANMQYEKQPPFCSVIDDRGINVSSLSPNHDAWQLVRMLCTDLLMRASSQFLLYTGQMSARDVKRTRSTRVFGRTRCRSAALIADSAACPYSCRNAGRKFAKLMMCLSEAFTP